MSLLQMSFSGAVMIIAILLVRMVAINKLPKIVFVVLWEIAFLRLLIPISVPSVFSAYSMIRENHITQEVFTEGPVSYLIPEAQEVQFAVPALIPETQEVQSAASALIPEAQEVQSVVPAASIPLWMILWIAGIVICALFFLISYLRCYREFRMSLPVSNAFAEKWLKEHQIKRGIRVRQSDRISSPLTYGIFRPVILMPKATDWEDLQRLQYILQHEYVHIRRFDMIRKLVAALVLCIHWFNPAVWLMYLVYNRDIELSCDERVIREFGESSKPLYAKALIAMEEKRNSLQPLSNSFSKNAIEERIKAVMKTKKVTVWAAIISIAVIAVIAVVFATSANTAKRDEQVSANTTGEDTTPSAGSINNTNIANNIDHDDQTREDSAEIIYHKEDASYSLEHTIQDEIMSGDFSSMTNTESRKSMEEDYQRWEESGIIEEMEWRLVDLNGDGIDDLILQEIRTVGESQQHRIVAIFACERDSASCILLDLNDGTEYSFCGPTGELMYTAPYSGTAIAGEPYRHYYYDSEWNKINDYWLNRTIVDSSMDGSREEFLQYNHGFIEAHPDMAEDGEYYSRYEIDIETGELKEREALSYEQFKEIFEDVMGMEYKHYYFY